MAKNKLSKEDLEKKKQRFEKVAGNLEQVSVPEYIKRNFLPYAWSFILDRALVDETGLKPVQRRILYTMYEDGLSPSSHRSKVATLAGRVLAYHPHGDASVTDALKNIARPHIFRVPLIDGKGDFGSPGEDGAQGRYIEARLSKPAWINVEEIGQHAVSMVPNHDKSRNEPEHIPVRWPVSLINGGSGIAVGYAAKIPSHNPTEIMDALILLTENPDISDDELYSVIQGPDFNMGGIITATDGVESYLKTGKGSFKIRGNYEIIDKGRSAYRIEFDEIPYGTNPEGIIESIQKGMQDGLFKEVASCKNLSDLRNPIRVVIETKPSVNPKKVLQDLFKHTPLETNFAANITTIIDNTPVQSSVRTLLEEFIGFREMCVKNKTQYSLTKKKNRLHIIDGMLSLVDIDKAVSIIRSSDDTEIASQELQKEFAIDAEQAEYILSLQLRRLTKMDTIKLEKERDSLKDEITYGEKLLQDPITLQKHLMQEFSETRDIIGDERKTVVSDLTQAQLAQKEKKLAEEMKSLNKDMPCYIFRTSSGALFRSFDADPYAESDLTYGPLVQRLKTSTKSQIVVVLRDGTAKRMPVGYISPTSASDHEDLRLASPIVGVAKESAGKGEAGIALATNLGNVKISKTDFPKSSDVFGVVNLEDGEHVIDAHWISDKVSDQRVLMVSQKGNALLFPLNKVRPSGSRAGTVAGMKLKGDDDSAVSFNIVHKSHIADTLIVSRTPSSLKTTHLAEIPEKGRGTMGVVLMTFRAGETPSVVSAYASVSPTVAMEGDSNTLVLPPITRRGTKGSSTGMPLLLGAKSLEND